MRILHIATEMTWRGGENQLRLLLEGLRQVGTTCHVVARPGSQAATRLAPLASVLSLPMRGGFNPRAAIQIARYCRRHHVQLLDAHSSHAHSLGLMVKWLMPDLKLVVHRRVDYQPGRDFINRRKYMSQRVDAYVAISKAIKEILTAYGLPRERIYVARSAVDGTKYQQFDRSLEKAALAKTYGLDASLPFLGNASALTEQKGYDILMRAVKNLKERGHRFHCFIAGDGHLRDDLERLRITLNLEHDVTFLGFIDDVPRFLSALDVLAVPSNYEGLGTIILDGIHAGLSVAATAVGGIPEMIQHEVTGLLSNIGDAQGLSTNLARLLSDKELRTQLAKRAKNHIDQNFSVRSMVEDNLRVYKTLLPPQC